MSSYPVIIGRFEYIDLVDVFDVIPAKIDTGANRSSIHATNFRVVEQDGKDILEFTLLGHPAYDKSHKLTTDIFSTVEVKSSNGHISKRYKVDLKVKLGYKIFNTSFTLADRSSNVFPVLVGREALRKRFIVDPDRTGVKRSEIKLALDKSPCKEEIEGVNV
jgi:hypothetical protein